jgi:AraC-like DNA-binding protein
VSLTPTEAALATLPFNSVFCFARSRRLPLHIRWIIRAAASERFDVIDHITPAHATCPPDDLHSSIELVGRAIQDRLTGHCPTIDAIAQALHMSSRTIQRHLQDAGYSFQRVLDEARHQMARYYLSNAVPICLVLSRTEIFGANLGPKLGPFRP